ncbi:MAG: SDR family NAD(P)-dependent oxidoreductase, partial [Planctomycetes bacterium]|nr:SDR family NAD(P)-dependent oxidoreductase [Planctomycetota bacterium]
MMKYQNSAVSSPGRFLDGKVCLVTGSARKVGRAMALALADAGGDVAVQYLTRPDDAKKTVASIRERGRRTIMVRADVTREKQVDRMFNTVESALGTVDVLVNNVGNFLLKPLSKIKPSEWHGILDSNLHCSYYCCRRALPLMRKKKSGRIV